MSECPEVRVARAGLKRLPWALYSDELSLSRSSSELFVDDADSLSSRSSNRLLNLLRGEPCSESGVVGRWRPGVDAENIGEGDREELDDRRVDLSGECMSGLGAKWSVAKYGDVLGRGGEPRLEAGESILFLLDALRGGDRDVDGLEGPASDEIELGLPVEPLIER